MKKRKFWAAALLAAAIGLVVLAGCGGPTDRPLTVRVTVRFDYVGDRHDPQPILSALYSWDGGPEQLLLQKQAGSGALSTTLQRPANHGSSYTLTVRLVRDDTGQQMAYATQVFVVPWDGEPVGGSISLRDTESPLLLERLL